MRKIDCWGQKSAKTAISSKNRDLLVKIGGLGGQNGGIGGQNGAKMTEKSICQNRSTISLKLQHVLRHNYDYTFNDLLMYVGAVLATKSHQTSNMYVF